MPHIDIKSFPKTLTEQQKQALAEAMTDLITEHFSCKPGSVSVALSYVDPEQWKSEVWEPEIQQAAERLIKKPEYSL